MCQRAIRSLADRTPSSRARRARLCAMSVRRRRHDTDCNGLHRGDGGETHQRRQRRSHCLRSMNRQGSNSHWKGYRDERVQHESLARDRARPLAEPSR